MQKFYYLRDKENKPRVTICEEEVGGLKAVGIAVCSLKDNPCKKVGKAIAAGRAKKAWAHGVNEDPVKREDVCVMLTGLDGFWDGRFNFFHKSQFIGQVAI